MFDASKQNSFYGNSTYTVTDLRERDRIVAVTKALSHPLRLDILDQLLHEPRTVTELARINGLTNSTVLFHLRMLEEASLIICRTKPNKKGKTLVFYINFNTISFTTQAQSSFSNAISMQTVSVGSFSQCETQKYLRIGTSDHFVVLDRDDVYNTARFDAGLIGIDNGSVTYEFSNAFAKQHKLLGLEFSLEVSSESPYFRNDWKSEILFSVCGIDVACYLSPGDFGGERGRLTPSWWDDRYSQYGLLVTLLIDHEGVRINGEPVKTSITVDDLPIQKNNRFSFGIRTDPNRKYAGGFNIFGKTYGNFAQDIVMKAYLADHANTNP